MVNKELTLYKDKKVLVTGHSGFKGSWLCQVLLELGAEVCGISLKPEEISIFNELHLNEKLTNHFIDIRNFTEVKKVFDDFKPEIVFHLAAQPLVIESYNNPRYTYDVNVMGTVNVCECVRESESVKSFINVTTDKVYENIESYNNPRYTYDVNVMGTVNVCECVRESESVKSFINVTTDKVYENIEDINHYYTEDEKLNGFDPYSNSKSCSELVTQSYINSFLYKDKAVSTCRSGNVVGGGDFAENRIIPDCVKATVKNEKIMIRNPNSYRPYQHVLEADYFYLLLGIRQYYDFSLAGHYNIGPDPDNCISTKELVDLFVKYWEGAEYNIADFNGPHEANFLKLDSTKAKNILGWKPKWNIDQCIMNTVQWYKAFYNNEDILDITKEQIKQYIED